MEPQNRNLLFILLGAALLLCCCCALLLGAATAFMIQDGNVVVPQERPAVEGPVVVVTQAPTPTRQPAETAEATGRPTASPESDPSGTEALLAEAEVPARDLRELALRFRPGVDDIPVVVNESAPAFEVGDTETFWIENSDTQEHREVTAVLLHKTDHVYMWGEQGVRFDTQAIARSAEQFESQTYPINREFFGSEWVPGVDNDVHLSILHARGLGQNIAGYYSSADEFSSLINPYSNEKEMFYISADADSAEPNTSFYDGVLAHEFQHMIHWANDRNEDSWVNEGMSELAGHLNGFDAGGADIAYATNPDTQLTTWADPSEGNAEHYGASYLFMTYFLNRFGEDLTKAVVASPENGIAGFDHALSEAGRSERFDDVFADWVIANYLDRPEETGGGRFGYTDIDPYPPVLAETHRRFPASGSAQVSQYAADYIRLMGRGDVTISFEGRTQVGLVDTELRGRYAWWTNRGDDSNMTLTRPFDLQEVASATLTFATWYDIEEGWDYAYVSVSTDGGEHWEILPGLHTTDENPVGNAFGPGWTGISGGGSTPEWVEEQVDLTPFAGQEILLRFEYVTDDAVNRPGLLIDDLAIPEIDYLEDGENGAPGWEAAGWVLMDNRLEQEWLVQVLGLSEEGITVERMAIGEDGTGRLQLDDLDTMGEAIVIVSALAPVTTEPAGYDYSISTE